MGLIGVSVALVGWSIFFRLDLVTEAQSHMHTPVSLSRQVEDMRSTWSDEEEVNLQQEWREIQAKSFEDYDHFVRWVTELTNHAKALHLQVSYKIGETSTPIPNVPDLHMISMDLTVNTTNLSQGYQHFMEFVRELSENELQIKFTMIEMTGTGRGAQSMELHLEGFIQQVT